MKKVVRYILLGLVAYITLSLCGGVVLWIFRATTHLLADALKVGLIAGALLLAAGWIKKRYGK